MVSRDLRNGCRCEESFTSGNVGDGAVPVVFVVGAAEGVSILLLVNVHGTVYLLDDCIVGEAGEFVVGELHGFLLWLRCQWDGLD